MGAVGADEFGGRPEGLVGDTHHRLRARHLLGGERVAVRLVAIGEVGARVADVAAQHEQARPLGDGDRTRQRGLERVAVVGDLAQLLDMPAVGREAGGHVVAVGERGVAVDGDVVVVVDADQVAQPLMPGERGRFVADPLHQAAITRDHERAMVHHALAEAAA